MSTYVSPWVSDDLELYRSTIREFIHQEFVPAQERWRAEHGPDREAWRKAGELGMLLPDLPEDIGGGGGDFRYQAVVLEELARAGVPFGVMVQSGVAHYLRAYGTPEQQAAWIPKLASGELVAAIAMTEPDAGSDLQALKTTAIRQGDHYVINGSKTFITNGRNAGLVCLAVRTNPAVPGPGGISLLMVETDGAAGYRVGRPLDKVGLHGQDTCELFFDNVRVPASNLLGGAEGRGFFQMMEQLPYERLSIAVQAIAMAEQAVALASRHVKERKAFGKPLVELQHVRFKLAECATNVRVGRVFVDHAIELLLDGRLDAVDAAMAKYWLTECQFQVIDECVQLFGGYGYVLDYPIARMWVDCRMNRIGGGTTEIMKEVIGWAV